MAAALQEAATSALKVHGIGEGQAPAKRELWDEFCARPEAESASLEVENRFYAGYSHSELDWARPVHALLVDFKGDGMQLGKLLERLEARGEQYVFLGNPLPFNGGWHFSAVNDFEQPEEQRSLDPAWQNIRVWHRVNFVATATTEGLPAITAREEYDPADKAKNAVALGEGKRFSSIFMLGGLMAHTLVATALADNGPAGQLLCKHLEMGARLAVVGHGLDMLLACGTAERSIIHGCEAAVFPRQDRLAKISGLRKSTEGVCCHEHASGAVLVSASHCGPNVWEAWLEAAKLPKVEVAAVAAGRVYTASTKETVWYLDLAKLPGVTDAEFNAGEGAPRVAVFADEVADPVEVYTIAAHLMAEKFSFQLVSRSDEQKRKVRRVTTETVFGNAMYPLRDCCCVASTTPANLVPADARFDGFFVAGGQCPYQLLQDEAVTRIMDSAPVAAAVCHGPEALAGSKWLRPEDAAGGNFVSYYGAWISFRDVLHRYERKKPGEVCQDASGRLFTGNAPNSTKAMATEACNAIRALKASTAAAS